MDLGWMIAAAAVAGIAGFLVGVKHSRKAMETTHAAIKKEIEEKLKGIASDVLQNSQTTFLQLADENFKKHKQGAEAELEARKTAVEALVNPLNESLKAYKKHIEELEKARSQSYGSLYTELKNVIATQDAVRSETSKLVNALRAAPKTRGRWGEHTLRRVIELSGLSQHCDFDTEKTFRRSDALLRPDLIINLPGKRKLVVDAKTPLTAYLDAVDATEEEERDRHLKRHVDQVRNKVKELSGKSYWNNLLDNMAATPDFVVMFIPGDNFYTAAIERDPGLFEDAAAQRVVIVTPATLIALAKAVAFGWRQEKVAEETQQVHGLGKELYQRFIAMNGHIIECGKGINKSVGSYNKFIGSLEHSVMPQARKLNELEFGGNAGPIKVLEPVEVEARGLQSRDFDPDKEDKTPRLPDEAA